MKRTSDMLNEINKKTNHPDGTYVSVKLSDSSQEELDKWVTDQGIENPYDPKEYHSTVLYSTVGVPKAKYYDLNLPIQAKIKEWKKFDTKLSKTGKCLVGVVDSDELQKHHKNLINNYGATHSYPEYHPHITVSYDYDSKIPDSVPSFNLTYDTSEFKALDPDYKPTTKK